MEQKRYMVFIDTLGEGLESIDDLDIYDGERQLKDAVLNAASHILGGELNDYKDYERSGLKLSEQIVIVELIESEKMNNFIYDSIDKEIKTENNKEYKLFLNLKEKYENEKSI
jgi:hypothetical protein